MSGKTSFLSALVVTLLLVFSSISFGSPPVTDPPLRGTEFVPREVTPGDKLVCNRLAEQLMFDGVDVLQPEFRDGALFLNGVQVFPSPELTPEERAKESQLTPEMIAKLRPTFAGVPRVREILDGEDPMWVDDQALAKAWAQFEAELKVLQPKYQDLFCANVGMDLSPASINWATEEVARQLREEALVKPNSVLVQEPRVCYS